MKKMSSDATADTIVVKFPSTAPTKKAEAAWLSSCQLHKGRPLNNLVNVLVALRSDPLLNDAFELDEMLQTIFLTKALPGDDKIDDFVRRPLTDQDVTRLREYLQNNGLTRASKDTCHEAIELRATECRRHHVREYLLSLDWDNVPRVMNWLPTYMGVPPTDYSRGVGLMFLVAMVARVLEPGCKADYMLILEGAQGTGKSSACRILGGEWFSDSLPDVTAGKDVSQHLAGKWVIEIAEMSAMTKAESAHLKAFVTRNMEQYRPPYGRKEVKQPRQCVFIGTTNKSAYLRDETGGRRFWPVATAKIDLEKLAKDRDQLLAEAVELYKQDVAWYPDIVFEREHILPEQEERFDEDPWAELVSEHLHGRETPIHLKELYAVVLQVDTGRVGRATANRVTAILERMGWSRLKKDGKGNRPWGPPTHDNGQHG